MAPIPLLLLWSCLCSGTFFDRGGRCTSPSSPGARLELMADDGVLRFRAERAVDVSIGYDGANPDIDLTADRGVYISNDGLRHAETLLNVGHKKPRRKPNALDDRLAEWMPVDDTNINLDADMLSNMDRVSGQGKRKRYESSDDPMAQWRKEKQFFLDETVRREGLDDSECALCKTELRPAAELRPEGAPPQRIFRCSDCGEFVQCLGCCISHHAMSPLHFLEVRHKSWALDVLPI
ncbi:hypothetical protein DFH06DRAFT_1149734 [Mycena polygramma]|nr:hypothetical protein DFH06DRAFT_1152719 [Mycena polygramma]KAJ7607000.1 hypothetical protein DFH06DRAFT_1149734 [Mycena polygramma]